MKIISLPSWLLVILMIIPIVVLLLVSIEHSSVPSHASNSISDPDLATVFFPQLKPDSGPQSYPAAEMAGSLVVMNGCLRLLAHYDGSSWLLVWPSELTLRMDMQPFTILDHHGEVVWRVGQDVAVGGGEVPIDTIRDKLRAPLPRTCQGPYWIVSNVQNKRGNP